MNEREDFGALAQENCPSYFIWSTKQAKFMETFILDNLYKNEVGNECNENKWNGKKISCTGTQPEE